MTPGYPKQSIYENVLYNDEKALKIRRKLDNMKRK